MSESRSKYLVVVDRVSWVEGEGRDSVPAYGNKGDEVELTKEQADRLVSLGSVRKAAKDVEGAATSEVKEDKRELGPTIPEGQADPASLAQTPPAVPGPPVLTAEQVSAQSIPQLVGFAETHPNQVDSLIKLEKAGRKRQGVIKALEGIKGKEDEVPAEASPNPEEAGGSSPEETPGS